MMIRRTLNGRPPHTMKDSGRDPFDYVEHYRAPWLARWWWAIARVCAAGAAFGLLALIGALLGWGGRSWP